MDGAALRGHCVVRPSDAAAEAESISALYSVEACRTHGGYCKVLVISDLPFDGGAWGQPTVLHDWAADLAVHPSLTSAELPFENGLDTYVAMFSQAQAVARLKAVAGKLATAQRGPQSINPSRFYGGAGPSTRCVLKAFHRQDDAFEYCDRHRDIDLKVLCFESEAMMGRRRFVAAEVSEFVRRYSTIAPLERHVYEIIREGYPCRIYLDLEYAKDYNINANGEEMVRKVVRMLCWKLYELFGLVVGPRDIVDLDSSNEKKFSRHVTVVLPSSALDRCKQNVSKRSRDTEGEEVLFENNLVVGRVIAAMIEEMFDPDIHTAPFAVGAAVECIDGTAIDGLRIRPYFRDLWVRNKDGKLTCFIDTGVYTRNRAFRLLSSCKYGKTAVLKVSGNKEYNDRIRRRYRELDSEISEPLTQQHLRQRLYTALLLSFVVPTQINASFVHSRRVHAVTDDVSQKLLHRRGTHDTILGWSEPAPGAVIRQVNPFGKSSSLLTSSISVISAPSKHYNAELKRYLRRISPLVTYHDGELRGGGSSGNREEARVHAHGLNTSPFPALDEFVCDHVNRNGAPGHISSWTITYASDHPDRGVVINSSGTTHAFKVTYQIAGNKFCARIGRQHKSNHVMIVVDCDRGCMCQKCWDPDCRGFSSNEIIVPALVLPSSEELKYFATGAD